MSAISRPRQIFEAISDRAKVSLVAAVVRRSLEHKTRVNGKQIPFVVYFADVPSSAYQVEQWLRPLEALNSATGQVALLIRNPIVAQRVASQTDLLVRLADKSELVERFVNDHGARVVFYVNNSQSNFTTLRINGPVHIHLSHGESDKASMYSNQLKAYDMAFVAGDVSAERILAHVPRIDPSHLVRIGRPQLDVQVPVVTSSTLRSRITVLYAPTWEGDSRQMAYGSLVSHGEALIERLVSDPHFKLVFRPHPKTGSVSAEHRAALKRIKRRLEAPLVLQAGHTSDTRRDAVVSIVSADVVVCDVSAIAMDALGVGKPLVLCSTGGVECGGLAEHVQTWHDSLPSDAASQLAHFASEPASADQEAYRLRVFATGTPAEAVQRFIEESSRAAGLRDAASDQ